MTRLAFAISLVVLLSACGSEDAAAPEPDASVVAALPPPGALADAPDEGEKEAELAEAPPAETAQYPGAGSTDAPLSGVEVCEALETALLAMRINAIDLDLYATQAVIDELRENTTFRNPETGENEPEDVGSWVDEGVPGQHCSLSAGGDAWYRIQLVTLPGGRGDYAAGYTIATSYDNGGP